MPRNKYGTIVPERIPRSNHRNNTAQKNDLHYWTRNSEGNPLYMTRIPKRKIYNTHPDPSVKKTAKNDWNYLRRGNKLNTQTNTFKRVVNASSRVAEKIHKPLLYYTKPFKYKQVYPNKKVNVLRRNHVPEPRQYRKPETKINDAYLTYLKQFGLYNGNHLNKNYINMKTRILKELNALPVWNTRRHNRNPNRIARAIKYGSLNRFYS